MAAANGVFVAIVYSAFNLCVFLLSLGGVIGPCTDFRYFRYQRCGDYQIGIVILLIYQK